MNVPPGKSVMMPASNSEAPWKEEGSNTNAEGTCGEVGEEEVVVYEGSIPMAVLPDQRSPWRREGVGPWGGLRTSREKRAV